MRCTKDSFTSVQVYTVQLTIKYCMYIVKTWNVYQTLDVYSHYSTNTVS